MSMPQPRTPHVTPIGDQPLLSLVPPAAPNPGEAPRHPDPIARTQTGQPLPTNEFVPIAPVRRRQPVTPLISLAYGMPLHAAMSVAPIIPAQQVAPQTVQFGPGAYGVQPTMFPFPAAPAFSYSPQVAPAWAAPPVQTYIAFVNVVPQQPAPQMMQMPQVAFAPQQMPMQMPMQQPFGWPQPQQYYAPPQQPFAPQQAYSPQQYTPQWPVAQQQWPPPAS
jgi:hypothetical protein